jgi:hypothetical protein
VLKARLLGKVHQAPHDKTPKSGTSQAMNWTWLQEGQGPTREDRNFEDSDRKGRILRDKELHLNSGETDVKGPHAEGRRL